MAGVYLKDKSTGNEMVTLAHGAGGVQSSELIHKLFIEKFSNSVIERMEDSAIVDLPNDGFHLAFTTDSFVVNPIFFKGGDIGKLAVCGTVNDLSCVGAVPRYLTMGFIIEEGFPISSLEKISESIAATAASCGVSIVAGDTKVVPSKAADGIFINSAGIGIIKNNIAISCSNATPGDIIIVSGGIGEHGAAILLARDDLGLQADIGSDCAPLNNMIHSVISISKIHTIRDITRGGLAAVLNEISGQSGVGMTILEDSIPLRKDVSAVCEILGLDPLNMACEGRVVLIVPPSSAIAVLGALRNHADGSGAQIIGEVTNGKQGRVSMVTSSGGTRVIFMPSGEQLPRIC